MSEVAGGVHTRRGVSRSLRPMMAVVSLVALALAGGASVTLHRVRQGETLSQIASHYRVSVGSVAAANHLRDPDRIDAGATLTIPGPASPVPPAAAATTDGAKANGADFIDVKAGESLAHLARRAGVTPAALAAVNGIVDGAIYAGARYRVPRPGDPTSAFVASQPWRCPVAVRPRFMNDWGFRREAGLIHQGNDLFAARGTAVLAPVSGRVVRDPNHLGGNAFRLYGDDGVIYYGAHLERYGKQGHVAAGTVIGYVGNTGDAAGGPTHLHFEMHPAGGAAVNPYPTLRRACG